MKILFISGGDDVDYQCDVVFHGLKKLYGRNVYETVDNWFMFDDISDKQKSQLYGKGFTITGLLDAKLKNVITIHEVKKKLKQTFFDLVIFGSIWRCADFFDLASCYYSKEKIIAIDGEDDTTILKSFVRRTLYFKREFDGSSKGVFPISFGIPKEKIINEIKQKEKILAHIIPEDKSTYIYENENDYYNDYAISYFGKTTKKAGWDCLRHYEIIANGCIPYFPDLSKCPRDTMVSFPKDIILNTNDIFAKIGKEIHVYDELLKEYSEQILTFCKNHLTTERIVEYLINIALNQRKMHKVDNNIIIKRKYITLKKNRRIFLFGSGKASHNAANLFPQINWQAFVESDCSKVGKHDILPIISFSEFIENSKNALIVISSFLYAYDMRKQLIDSGFSQKSILFLVVRDLRSDGLKQDLINNGFSLIANVSANCDCQRICYDRGI